MDAGGHFTLQIAAKTLQIATWLLLTAYRNLPTVPSSTNYITVFSNSTKRYGRQTDRTMKRTNSWTILMPSFRNQG